MKRLVPVALLALLHASVASAAATPTLHPVVVHLRAPAAAADATPGGGERALRARAQRTQAPLLAAVRSAAASGDAADVHPLWIVDAVALRASDRLVQQLARRADVASVEPDAPVALAPFASPAAADVSVASNLQQIEAPALWSAGITGQGVVVASLDTGADTTDPELAAAFRGGPADWFDPYGQHAAPVDLNGHGTWTLGVVVGGGDTGTAVGVAPGARWIAARIFDDSGRATTSAVHAAFQWALDPDGDPATPDGADVVDAPWAITGAPGCDTTFEPDIQALRTAGVLAVFAAGNAGPGAATSVSPANNPGAIAVGALDASGAAAGFSSRGPSACGGGGFPTLAAPGVGIPTVDRHGFATTEQGTSLAAPHVAGALALLLSAYPGLSADEQEAALRAGAVDVAAPGFDEDTGAGALDVLATYRSIAAPPPLFAEGFEGGDLTRFAGSRGRGLQVTPAAALDGALGLDASGVAGRAYAVDRSGAGSTAIRLGLLLANRGAETGGAWDDVVAGVGAGGRLFALQVRGDAGALSLRVRFRAGRRMAASAPVALSPGVHRLALAYGPAGVTLTVDGAGAASLGTGSGSPLEQVLLGPSRTHVHWTGGSVAIDDYTVSPT